MDRKSPYFKQVDLLVKILPAIVESNCFALKGGTAINLFYRNIPRLSVDIDLVYVPIKDRITSLNEISLECSAIAERVKKMIPNSEIQYSYLSNSRHITKLLIKEERSTVIIEISPVLRGTVYSPSLKRISHEAETNFGFAEITTVSFEDLFAGKVIAALDRQHPRDFFDVKYLLENTILTRSFKEAFIVYLISHNRRFVEILNPSLLNIRQIYENEFIGMTREIVSIEEIEKVRKILIREMNSMLDQDDKKFLLNFKKGKPDWDYFSLAHIKDLPAVKWKMHNQVQMSSEERNKMVEKLRSYFNM